MKLYYLKSELPKTELAPNYNYVILENTIKINGLKKLILKREKEVSDGFDISLSRFKYFNKQFWLKKIIKNLEKDIKINVAAYLKLQFIIIPKDLYIQAWINVMRKEQAIDIHQHDCSPYSFLSGNICIDTKNTQTHYINPINFHHLDKTIYSSDNTPGKITIFPSCLPHYTDKYEESSERITIAFDIFVKNHPAITEKWNKVPFFDDNIKPFVINNDL